MRKLSVFAQQSFVMEAEIKVRLTWVKLYEETKNAGYVCRHCGISRPTLRKWAERYKDLGETGLNNQSKRPINSPNKKVDLLRNINLYLDFSF